MERFFTLASIVGIVTAAVFFWFHYFDAMFVAAVLGCVAWFLSLRFRIKNSQENS